MTGCGAAGSQLRELLEREPVRPRGVFDRRGGRLGPDECAGRQHPAGAAGDDALQLRGLGAGLARSPQPVQASLDRAPEFRGDSPVTLSVVVVSWNTRERLRSCLNSLTTHLGGRRSRGRGGRQRLRGRERRDGGAANSPMCAVLINDEQRRLRPGRQPGDAGRREGDWLLVLNSDIELIDDSVARLVDDLAAGEAERIGVAQCQLRFPDGRVQHSTYRFPSVGRVLFETLGLYKLMPAIRRPTRCCSAGYWDHSSERDVDWVAGALMLLPRGGVRADGRLRRAAVHVRRGPRLVLADP